jgi:hypothetical protein
MRTLPVILIRPRLVTLLLVALLACDPFEGELPNQIEFTQTEFYILPGSSTVIDLKAIIKKSFISVYLTIGEGPLKGTLTQMDAFVYKYTPNYNFIEGTDQFMIAAVLDDGTTASSTPMIVYMKSDKEEFPCGLYAVEDDIRMDPARTAVINVLKNDHICDLDEPVNVVVHLAPKFGEAVVVGDSIIYTPGPSFSRSDEFVYSLSTSSGEEISFGLVSFNKPIFEVLEIPVGLTSIFFVDDMIGFIAGRQTIQKTIDGGRHWIQLTHPVSENKTISIGGIYFLDKDHGFAAFSHWPCQDPFFVPDGNMGMVEVCPSKYMETKNAGVSWDIVDLGDDVLSIFNSPLQTVTNPPHPIISLGFSPDGDLGVAVSGTTTSGWPARQMLTISISTDKGKTWADLAQHPDGSPSAISVPSSNVAYILCWGKIIKYSL